MFLNGIRKIINKHELNFKSILFFGLMFFLPVNKLLDNIFLSILFIFGLVSYSNIKITSLLKYSLVPFFLFIFFLVTVTGNFFLEIKSLKILIPLLILPIALEQISRREVKLGLIALSLGIFFIQLKSIYGIFTFMLSENSMSLSFRNSIKINSILQYERPYLGYFSALNCLIAFIFLFRRKLVLLSLILLVISIFVILFISARMAFLILIFTAILLMFFKVIKTKLNLSIFISITLLIISLMMLFKTPLIQRFYEMKFDSRVIIWSGVKKSFLAEEKYIFGSGSIEKNQEKLLLYYKNDAFFEYEPDKLRFVRNNYNTHNQYLNEIIRSGVLGLVIFLFPFYMLLKKSLKQKEYFSFVFIISLLMFLFVENLLARQIGVYLLGIFLVLSNKFSYES